MLQTNRIILLKLISANKKCKNILYFFICTLCINIGMTLISSKPSYAYFKTCNSTNKPIKLSVAYNEKNFNHVTPYQYQLKEIVNPKSSVFKGWKIQGWFNISPGRCINVLPLDLTNIKQVYINANSDDRKYRWNGNYSFCVSNQAFNYKIVPKIKFNYSTLCRYNFSNDKIRNDGLFNLGFRKIRLPRAKNYTMNLL